MYKTCSIDDCENKLLAKNLCANHYALMRRNGKPEKQIRKWQLGCSINGCEGRYAGNGYCSRHYEVKRMFGLEPEMYEDMLLKQKGLCAICNEKCKSGKRLHVDHNHETGMVRGLLCSNCNRGIGLLSDSVEKLKSSIIYLEQYNQ